MEETFARQGEFCALYDEYNKSHTKESKDAIILKIIDDLKPILLNKAYIRIKAGYVDRDDILAEMGVVITENFERYDPHTGKPPFAYFSRYLDATIRTVQTENSNADKATAEKAGKLETILRRNGVEADITKADPVKLQKLSKSSAEAVNAALTLRGSTYESLNDENSTLPETLAAKMDTPEQAIVKKENDEILHKLVRNLSKLESFVVMGFCEDKSAMAITKHINLHLADFGITKKVTNDQVMGIYNTFIANIQHNPDIMRQLSGDMRLHEEHNLNFGSDNDDYDIDLTNLVPHLT